MNIKPQKPYAIERSQGKTYFYDDAGRHYATYEKGIQHGYVTFYRRVEFGEMQHVYRNIEL